MDKSEDMTLRDYFLQACEEGKGKLVSCLLEHGVNPNWQQSEELHQTGLHLAAKDDADDNLKVLDLLLENGADVDIPAMGGTTPLMVACINGLVACVFMLTDGQIVDVNRRCDSGRTALHYAVPHPACVAELKQSPRLDWNQRDNGGRYPVTMAAEWGCAGTLEIMLALPPGRVDLNVQNKAGKNIAWLAVQNRSFGDPLRCVQLLARDERINWNTQNISGDTPLMFCLKNNLTEMAKIILSIPSVDLHIRNNDGKYPEGIAREQNQRDILDLMKSGGEIRLEDRMPECLVCLDKFKVHAEVHQCQQGHFVCGRCRPRLPGSQTCPYCRGKMMGRAHGFEDFLRKLAE